MELDLNEGGRVHDYCSVPAGIYRCRIAEVRPGTTRAGDERWSVRLVVADGSHVGKQAAWDSLVFSARGQARARLVLQALGLPHTGVVQLEPHDLEGRSALVEVRPAEYQSPTGSVVRRNEVPYDGFHSAGGSANSSHDASAVAEGGASAGAGRPGTKPERPPRRERAAATGDGSDDEIPF